MVLLTLIGEEQAKIGNRFYFIGPLTECKECRLKGVCFNLESGHQYEIIGIRDTKHECAINEWTSKVVEVEKIPTVVSIPKKLAIDGSMITFERTVCNNIGCENYVFCNPVAIKDETKVPIVEIIGKAECVAGENLVLVKVN